MKIKYFCPCLVKCIAQKLNKKIFELTMKQKDEIYPSQEDIKKFDSKINKTIKNIINTKCD